MADLHICCPHCSKDIQVNLRVEIRTEDSLAKGPPAYDPGPEVDAFIIEAIEERRLSLKTVAELLWEQGVPTAKGGRLWYPASVKRAYEHALARRAADTSETPR